MNNKAQSLNIWHWLVFVFIAAAGLFFLVRSDFDPGTGVKGEWQFTFMQDFLAADAKEISINTAAILSGKEVAKEISKRGGSLEDLGCGFLENVPKWNTVDSWCFPNLESATQKIKEKMEMYMPGRTFTNFNLNGRFLSADGSAEEIVTKNTKYQFDTGFAVDLGYDFNEYKDLLGEAQLLVNSCRNEIELKKCLEEVKPSYWNYQSCEKSEFPPETSFIKFCVVSLSNENINYNIALDFNPNEPFSITPELEYDANKQAFEISFSSYGFNDDFRIYFTDYTFLEGSEGTVEDLSERVLFEYFWDFHQINSFIKNCPLDKVVNQAYLCGEKIVYLISDSRIDVNTDYLFSVTSLHNGKESRIIGFVKGSVA